MELGYCHNSLLARPGEHAFRHPLSIPVLRGDRRRLLLRRGRGTFEHPGPEVTLEGRSRFLKAGSGAKSKS